MKERKVVFLVLAMKRVETLGSNAKGVRDSDADAAGTDIEAEHSGGRAFFSHRRIIGLDRGPWAFDLGLQTLASSAIFSTGCIRDCVMTDVVQVSTMLKGCGPVREFYMPASYRDLRVWQSSMELVISVYRATPC